MVREYLKQEKHFEEKELKQALEYCLQTDINIKTGKLNGEMAVELLLLKYSSK